MTLVSPLPPVDIPAVTLYDYLFGDLDEAARNRPAFLDASPGLTLTYGQLVDRIDAVAGALAARGIGSGDVIGLYAPNSAEFAIAFHGILRAGATATTVNTLYTVDDLAHQLSDAGAKYLFTVSALLPNALLATEQVGISDEKVLTLDDNADYATLTGLYAEGRPAPGRHIDPTTTIAALPYSSGTTGKPKGVMLTHHNLVANLCQIEPWIVIEPADRVLAVLPFFHIYGLSVVLNLSLKQRAVLVVMPRFDLDDFLRAIAEHRCTYLYVAPPIAVALAKSPLVDDFDLSSVTTVMSGAAPLDGELGRALERRLGCRVRQGYGMSELSPVSHVIPHNRDDISLATIGFTLPNIECKVVDPATGAEIPLPAEGSSAPGELWCRGPNVMVGYLNNPTATEQTIDSDGYLHTGDLVTVDSGGLLTVIDRLKELIKYKGYQVPPAELEALLLAHPLIVDAAVVGVPDGDGEEIPKAFVVLRHEVAVTATDVIDYVASKVSPHKKVRAVAFVDSIPKSAAGKILRRVLRTDTRPSAETPVAAVPSQDEQPSGVR